MYDLESSLTKLANPRTELERQTDREFHRALQAKHRWNRRLTNFVGVLGVVVLLRAIGWVATAPYSGQRICTVEQSQDRPPIQARKL